MMSNKEQAVAIAERHTVAGSHAASDYFAALSELVQQRKSAENEKDKACW